MVVDFQKVTKELKKLKAKKDKDSSMKAIKVKSVLRDNKATLTIKENKPEKYVPIYFQAELKEEKRKLFFE
jgi:hypothetical protein